MTKEELLKKIDFEKSWLCDCGIFGSDVDIAFHAIKNSAIEALEQESCEDCISRQAVIDEINEWIKSGEYGYTNATYYLRKRIDNLQPVNPQKLKTDVLDKLDEIITDALDNSTDQKESQTLRWVLDKISEVT